MQNQSEREPLDVVHSAALLAAEASLGPAIKIAAERLLAYASHDLPMLSAVFGYMEPAAVLDRDFGDYLNGLARKPPKAFPFIDHVRQCYEAYAAAVLRREYIRGQLRGDPERQPHVAPNVQPILAMVAALPVEVGRAIPELPENLTDLCMIEPGNEPFGSLVRGLLDRGGLAAIFGPTNAGKSFFALDMALHVATGLPWRGRPVFAGGVIYVAAEGGAGLKRRALAWVDRHGVSDAPFAVVEGVFDLTTSKGTDALLAVIQAWQAVHLCPAVAVFVDTLARSIGGADENSASTMMSLVSNADRIRDETGAMMCLVAHTGKGGDKSIRGHSGLPAALDTAIRVEPGLATVAKQRNGEIGATFPFRIVPVQIATAGDGAPIMSAVIEAVAEPVAVRVTKSDPLPELALAVREAAAAGLPYKLNRTGGLHDRRASLPAPLCNMGRDALRDVARAAIDAGLIVNDKGTLAALKSH